MLPKKIQHITQIVGVVTIIVLCAYGALSIIGGSSTALAALENITLGTSRIPSVITYQGMLRQADGTPIDGTFDMTFRLYTSPTAKQSENVHKETISAVVVRDGLFTVLLGDNDTTLDVEKFKDPLYVGVQVGDDAEMQPRQRLAPVPYAVQLTGGVFVDTDSKVGIGTTDPQAKLDVAGNLKVSGNITADGYNNGNLSIHRHPIDGSYYAIEVNNEPNKITMTSITNHVCFLTSVYFSRVSGDEDGKCQITQEDGSWYLNADLDGGGGTVECQAYCIGWHYPSESSE